MSDSFWSRYKDAINFEADLRDVLVRPHQRYATLDGVRAITVLLMVMFHVLFGIGVLFKDNIERLDTFITSLPRYWGWLWQSQGSDPLFIMCGLLVSYTFYREYEKTKSLAVLTFYKRRLIRVMPLFIVALLIYIPTDLADNWRYLISNLLFASNYIENQRHIIPVGWSLDVQIHFYIMLPFLVLLMYKLKWRLAFLIGLCLAAFVWRYYIVASDPVIWQTPFYQIIYDKEFGSMLADKLYYDIDARIGTFFLGMLVAYIYFYYDTQLKAFFARHFVLSSVLTLLSIAIIVSSLCLPVENKYHPFYENFDPRVNFWFLTMDRYWYSIGLCLLMVMSLTGSGVARWTDWLLSLRMWHPVAQLIFPIYLFHFPFIVVAAVIVFGTTDRDAVETANSWQVFGIFFVTLFFTFVWSLLMHCLVEKPFINLRPKNATPAANAATPAVAQEKA